MTAATDRPSNTDRNAQHATFVIERVFNARPEQVFHAWADPDARARWFAGPPGRWRETLREHDFRVDGAERLVGKWDSGTVTAFDARFQDIVPGCRIVFSYAMYLDGARISVSLATVELTPHADGTHMHYTEQGVFLDGYDDAGSREAGTQALLDRLHAELSVAAETAHS